MLKDLVSIIMLSRNKEPFLEASVRSVMAQTYKNWELHIVDDASHDGTISLLLKLKDEDRRRGEWCDGRFKEDGTLADRINITKSLESKGETVNRNSALKEVNGKWVAFLDAGDIWEPTKLERQVAFMEEKACAFSYTKFKSIDSQMKDLGIIMGGPECVSHQEMKKCCWMGYLTVMYDATKTGVLQVNDLNEANDYALWLQVAWKANCYLLPECLASQMSVNGLWYRLLTSRKWNWRYRTYRRIECMNPFVAAYMTVRNMVYAAWKWRKYAERG